ncbi:hypothetical protein [Phaffia rhodozyma]|uniref:Uncharacterized protein n=1 Tax=Phaffia rhodozyma TaxID=264483 RepID=A0A0F7SH05_PHARH|nr:hypothetical protein [Phaffia rhodozyma]
MRSLRWLLETRVGPEENIKCSAGAEFKKKCKGLEFTPTSWILGLSVMTFILTRHVLSTYMSASHSRPSASGWTPATWVFYIIRPRKEYRERRIENNRDGGEKTWGNLKRLCIHPSNFNLPDSISLARSSILVFT